MKTSNRSIGLSLSQTNLYPPLLGNAPAVVGFTTELAPGEDIEFSLVANGAPGTPTKVELRPGSSAGGTLWVQPGFVADHAGTWPVQLMLQASRQDEVIDTATLWLHDTRQMQVTRIAGELLPNPVHVSDNETVSVIVRAKFYDVTGLELPRDEVSWEVELPDAPPNLIVDQELIHIAPGTTAGEVNVVIRESAGVSVTLRLVLAPPLDIGFEISPKDLYPPILGEMYRLFLRTSLPPGSGVQFDWRLNGKDDEVIGMLLEESGGEWDLCIYRRFLENYHGPWPAEVSVDAVLDGQLAGRRTAYLHDTRNMAPASMGMHYVPSDQVNIPANGSVVVRGIPDFYDSQGVLLPLPEFHWDAMLDNEPLPGIVRTKHVLVIYPAARPSIYRLTIMGPEGLSVSKHLTLS